MKIVSVFLYALIAMNVLIAPAQTSAIIAICAVCVQIFVKIAEKYATVAPCSARTVISAKTV